MLATSNPEAIAEIDPNRDRRTPYQGQSLVYHCRPGEGRGGKLTAVALCTRVEDNDHVEILIVYAADDFITKWKIPRKTDQNNVNCWSFNAWDEEHYQPGAAVELPVKTEQGHLTWEDVKEMYDELHKLRSVVHELVTDGFPSLGEKHGMKSKRVKVKTHKTAPDVSTDD